MYEHDATESAYKNGYEKGYAAALAAIGYAKKLPAEVPAQTTTEKRLIEVETVIEKIRKANCADCYSCNGVLCRACLVDDFISLLDDSTAVDAVEVVRCKDCKHLIVANKEDIYAYCPKMNTCFLPFGLDTREHYCSCGVRRTDNEID